MVSMLLDKLASTNILLHCDIASEPEGDFPCVAKAVRRRYKLTSYTITPFNTTSKNAFGIVVNVFLAQMEKWERK